MIDDLLVRFPEQFSFQPIIENGKVGEEFSHRAVGGMGGSHLAAGLLNTIDPAQSLWIHKEYGLPPFTESQARETLFIASSYSGNTEETLDFARAAHAKTYSLAVVASGGELLQFAQEKGIPFVRLPLLPTPPRMNIGLSVRAFTALLGAKELFEELGRLTSALDTNAAYEQGQILAHLLMGKIPLIYASARNFPLAYQWKISFNENSKVQAFCNMLPEAAHNEIEGFDGGSHNPHIPFFLIMLADSADHPRIKKRMTLIQESYEKRGVPVAVVSLTGGTKSEKIFGSVLTANATAIALAKGYGNEAMQTPLLDQLKEKMRGDREIS